MKLLLILLACIAATNAAYCGYSYRYFCQRKFLVYPQPCSYSFRIYFSNSWCSYKYYAPVLKVYPGETCGKTGWTERAVAEVITEMDNALKESLLKITEQMNLKKAEWEKCLTERIVAYKEQFKTYITRYYEYLIQCAKEEDKAALELKRDDAIKEYNEKLDASKAEAIEKYLEAMAERIKTIQDYHKKLLENATKCLETRATKIGEYSVLVLAKIAEYVKQFTDCHIAVLDQKEKCYRALLDYLHGKDFETDKTNAVIAHFRAREMETINKLVAEYAAKLAEYKEKLVTYYTCAYRCYLSNACLRFYRRGYYSSCRSLGCWYRYKSTYCATRYTLNKFQYRYRETKYSCLKTCETMPVKTLAEITDPLNAKMEEVILAATEKFGAWKLKWAAYHVEYKKCYEEIMRKRHAWCIQRLTSYYVCQNNSEELTDEQKAKIAELTAELEAKLVKSCEEYAAKLLTSLLECMAKFAKSVEEYRTKVGEMITKIGTNYQSCLDTRTKKIAEYQAKLIADITARKEKMAENMVECKNSWLVGYGKMYKSYHGETLPQEVIDLHNSHVQAIIDECNVILAKCVANWNAIIPKLVEHYSCCYSCRVARFCMPGFCFGGYYRWSVKYPTACYYPYQYKTYRRTYCYRVRYVKTRYTYC